VEGPYARLNDRACLKQTIPFNRIIVVDDGSPQPVTLPEAAQASGNVMLLRLEQNGGISVARNFGMAHSTAPFLACINTEVLPEEDWLAVCLDGLRKLPTAGAGCLRASECASWKTASQTNPVWPALLRGTQCCFAAKRSLRCGAMMQSTGCTTKTRISVSG
jgi:GT2 family glycosyltransferase